MNNKEAKAPVPFSVMNGDGESFIVGDKKYTVRPMLVGDSLKFAEDGLSISSQLFNLANKEAKEKLDFYLSQYCFDENKDPMTIEKVIADKWSIIDLKNFLRKLCDLSG